MDTAHEYHNDLGTSSFPNDSITLDNENKKSLINNLDGLYLTISVTICLSGAVGNGVVIWLLAFRIKRNLIITYILNLAIADLGVLVSAVINDFCYVFGPLSDFYLCRALFVSLLYLMYSTSQFLLTAISIDRCVAVFFPLWHKCHQPACLSRFVCAFLWVLSFLITAVCYTPDLTGSVTHFYQFIVNGLLCLPIITVTTVALFVKLRLKARQHQRRKLLTVVSFTLVFFLFFAFPLNVFIVFNVFYVDHVLKYISFAAVLLACLNSSINPVIYTLVGRQRKSRRTESMKMILQKVFKEEEGCTERTPVETQI